MRGWDGMVFMRREGWKNGREDREGKGYIEMM